MGTEETSEEELPNKSASFGILATYIIKQLFSQKVMIGVIGVVTIYMGTRQYMNSDKLDDIKAQQDTVAVKQTKIDSTGSIRVKWQQKTDSVNRHFNSELDTIKANQLLILKYLKSKQ